MHKKFPFQLGRLVLILVYLAALGVAAALVTQTLQTAQNWPVFVDRPEPAPVVVIATATPAPVGAPLLTLPSLPTPEPAPVLSALSIETTISETVSIHPKSGRYIVAWLPAVMHEGAMQSFLANMDIIDDVSPFWYTSDGSGRLYGRHDDELVRLAQANNVRVIPSIHNVTNNPGAVITLLTDPQRRSLHIQTIVDTVMARGYDGIDIDYESLPASVRAGYSAFIRELAAELHARDKLLTVAVHAKDSDYGGLGGFQDWVEIGQHVDQLRIMTYDYHWRGSSPGPVAPAYWVQSVAEYARSVVDPSKVLIGVHFYGYDWPPSGPATARPWRIFEDIINEQGSTVNFVERNALGRVEESTFSYRSAQGLRTVWFMTRTGLLLKMRTIQENDLAGIAIWQLGYERADYWEAIREASLQDPSLIQRAITPLLPEH